MFGKRRGRSSAQQVDYVNPAGANGRPAAPDDSAYATTTAYRSLDMTTPGGVPMVTPGTHGVRGYAGLPGYVAPAQYQGAFSGNPISQYPSMLPGVQLSNGREGAGVGQRYYTPTALPASQANGGLTQTTRPNNISGAQRGGSTYQGPIGPLSVQQMRQNVVAQQVRQSGLAVMGWAKGLSPSYGGSDS